MVRFMHFTHSASLSKCNVIEKVEYMYVCVPGVTEPNILVKFVVWLQMSVHQAQIMHSHHRPHLAVAMKQSGSYEAQDRLDLIFREPCRVQPFSLVFQNQR